MKTMTMLPLCSVTPTPTASPLPPHQMLTAVVHGGGGGGAFRPVSLSPSPSLTNKIQFSPPSVSDFKSTVDHILSSLTASFDQSLIQAQNAVKTSSETINSLVDRTGESAGESVKNTAGEAALFGVQVLKRTIVGAEDVIANGASLALRSLETAKQSLPPEISDALDSALGPTGIALREVYGGIQGLEATLGLDPNDPVLPFLFLLATSTSLWVFYWVSTYSGYAGDLSPDLTLDILSGKENTLLVDIRPEALREKDGVPDLRRAARYRYTSVAIPEVNNGSQFRNVRELEDALTAAFIRNLKIAQDRSKVIVLDADGSRSKRIARSLKKLGVKEPYLVQGGFRSWAKEGLRIKELKPETAFSILNEEAEAILEDIKPSPLQLVGLGVGLIAASYAFLEWETTLQYIGVIGVGQTIFRRVASYEGAEDFKRDMGVLLTPARVGSSALGWAAGKLETNRVGLPTSPSSTDVQNRVLQAAAKHESQPSEPAAPTKPDLSEA